MESLESVSSAVQLKWNDHLTCLTWFPYLDFFLWVFLKNSISQRNPRIIAAFKTAITEKIQTIIKEASTRVNNNFPYHIQKGSFNGTEDILSINSWASFKYIYSCKSVTKE